MGIVLLFLYDRQIWIYDNIPFNWLLNQDKYGFHLLIEIDWWLQISCKMSENLWEKKHRQPNYIEKKNNSFLIENNSLDRYVLLQKKSFSKPKRKSSQHFNGWFPGRIFIKFSLSKHWWLRCQSVPATLPKPFKFGDLLYPHAELVILLMSIYV